MIRLIHPQFTWAERWREYINLRLRANWKKISTGRNSQAMASGRSWTMVIDPEQSANHLYEPRLRGRWGFKTINGGLDGSEFDAQRHHYRALWRVCRLDLNGPQRPRHLLVGWHAECPPPRSKACFAETMDGGTSWELRDGNPSWAGGESTTSKSLTQSCGSLLRRAMGCGCPETAALLGSKLSRFQFRTELGSCTEPRTVIYLGAGNGIVQR